MYTNGYLELDLFKVPFQLHWVRQGGKEWCTVLRLIVLMITVLRSTYVQAFQQTLFHLIFMTQNCIENVAIITYILLNYRKFSKELITYPK